MPLTNEDYRTPAWTKLKEGATLNRFDNDRFVDFSTMPRHFRDGGMLQDGYNPNNQSIRTDKIRLNNDNVTFKPY